MKKSISFLPLLALLALASCGEQSSSTPTPLISSYEADAMLVGGGYGSAECLSMPTFHHKDFGEVPFVDLSKLLAFIETDAIPAPTVKKIADHLYGIVSDGVIAALLDTENEILTIKRYDYLVRAFAVSNNGVPFDIGNPNSAEESAVHVSDKSKVHGAYKDEVYDLKEYHFDLAEQDDKVYVPAQLFTNILLRTAGADIIYNGHDFFTTSLNGPDVATCYSASDTFRYSDLFFQPLNTAPAGESKRYVAPNPSSKLDNDKFGIFALKEDGTGAFYHGATQNDPIPENPTAKLVWEIKADKDTYIGMLPFDPLKQEYPTVPTYMRIRHGEGYYNSKKRDASIASFAYNLLRFQFDELYGLREDFFAKQTQKDFDSFVTAKGLKQDLLSENSLVFDEALATFTMHYIDDGHTKYNGRSIFSGETEVNGSALGMAHQGPRRGGLLDKLTAYSALRREKTGLDNPLGLFMEGETAVIRFDAFSHIAAYIPALPEAAREYDIPFVMSVSTPWAFDMAFEQINANPSIKNVVLDLTCNGGGMVLTLPYLAAHFTKDPIIWSADASMGMVREFHYNVDLNHNGVFGEKEDTYAGKYDFFLLTSDFSFSCGTAFPAMARTAGVKIIGKRSGGGACSVGYYSDGCGSIYTTSSPLQIGTVNKEGYFIHDDEGISVDYELDQESWYDLPKLDAFVKGLKN